MPNETQILFKLKRDTGVTEGMSYVTASDCHEAVMVLQTIQKKYEGFTKKEVERAILACKVQGCAGNPPD